MKKLALALAVVAATMLFAVGAAAAVKTVKSTVTITSGEADEFTGKVTSPNKKCRDDRKVTLFMKPYGGGADIAVGSDRTNRSGLWRIEGSFVAGIYYARVASSTEHEDDDTLKCAVDLSLSARY
jgi:hypothetical protein